MSPRVTAVLFVAAAGLGAFVFFHELGADRDDPIADAKARRIFVDSLGEALDPDSLESLAFTTQEGTQVRVERREAMWWVVAPVDAPADQVEVDGMVSTLLNLFSEGVIEEPQAASVYGLDDEARSVRFWVGGREYAVSLGAKTPVGPNSYLSSSTSDVVFIVSTWKLNSLSPSLLELRDRRVLPFDPNSVLRFSASWPGGGVSLERVSRTDEPTADKGTWWLVAPARFRADDSVVETLLSDLSFLRAESFMDDELEDSETGLSQPVFEVSLTQGAGSSATGEVPAALHLALGNTLDGVPDRIVRGRSNSLFRVPQELLAELPRRVVDYRFKELSNFEPAAARSLELMFYPPGPGGSISIRMVRGEDGWSAASGDSSEALAPGRSSRLVAELAHLRAVDIVAESMGWRELAALGLSPPQAAFRVLGAPGQDGQAELLCETLLGNEQPGRGILAKAEGSDAVYRLDSGLADALPLHYGSFAESFASKEHPGSAGSLDGPARESEVRDASAGSDATL